MSLKAEIKGERDSERKRHNYHSGGGILEGQVKVRPIARVPGLALE